MQAQLLAQPEGDVRLGDFIESNLGNASWTSFRAAIAFVKSAGVKHMEAALKAFALRAAVKMSVGVSFGGTSLEGVTRLYEALGDTGEIWIFHNGNGSTFHPKIYLFRNDTDAHVAIGSGNLTGGGLFTNYEASVVLKLSLGNEADRAILQQIEALLDQWSNPATGLARELTDEVLDQLTVKGYVPPEAYTRETEEAGPVDGDEEDDEPPLFASVAVKPAPRRAPPAPAGAAPAAPAAQAGVPTVFYMTLQRTDVGTGQVTAGTSARSPEIFIPLAARNAAPAFWDWPNAFTADPARLGKMDRTGVRMLVGTNIEDVNMMTWPDKHDFRIRSEAIRSGGQIGDILRIEKINSAIGYRYIVNIIPQHSAQYATARALCVNPVRNSVKEWGYA